jgi:hypothetical protein
VWPSILDGDEAVETLKTSGHMRIATKQTEPNKGINRLGNDVAIKIIDSLATTMTGQLASGE